MVDENHGCCTSWVFLTAGWWVVQKRTIASHTSVPLVISARGTLAPRVFSPARGNFSRPRAGETTRGRGPRVECNFLDQLARKRGLRNRCACPKSFRQQQPVRDSSPKIAVFSKSFHFFEGWSNFEFRSFEFWKRGRDASPYVNPCPHALRF